MSPRRPPKHEPEHERPRMGQEAVDELRHSMEVAQRRQIGPLAGLSSKRLIVEDKTS